MLDAFTRSFTQRLKKSLITNGFATNDDLFYHIHRRHENRDIDFTFLGGGWVKKYIREYPAKEGWSSEICRCSEFFDQPFHKKKSRNIF